MKKLILSIGLILFCANIVMAQKSFSVKQYFVIENFDYKDDKNRKPIYGKEQLSPCKFVSIETNKLLPKISLYREIISQNEVIQCKEPFELNVSFDAAAWYGESSLSNKRVFITYFDLTDDSYCLTLTYCDGNTNTKGKKETFFISPTK